MQHEPASEEAAFLRLADDKIEIVLPSEFEGVNLTDPNISWGVISGFPSRTEYPVEDRARLDEMFSHDVQHSYHMRQLIEKTGLPFTCADGVWRYQDTHQIFDRSFVIFCHDDDERLDRVMWDLGQHARAQGSVTKHWGLKRGDGRYVVWTDCVLSASFRENDSRPVFVDSAHDGIPADSHRHL